MPASSRTSRSAVSAGDSPASTSPLGKIQCSRSCFALTTSTSAPASAARQTIPPACCTSVTNPPHRCLSHDTSGTPRFGWRGSQKTANCELRTKPSGGYRSVPRVLFAVRNSQFAVLGRRRSLRQRPLRLPPPGPVDRALARPDLRERLRLVQSPILHHVSYRVRVADVLQRIRIEHLKVREPPSLQRSELLSESDRLGAEHG